MKSTCKYSTVFALIICVLFTQCNKDGSGKGNYYINSASGNSQVNLQGTVARKAFGMQETFNINDVIRDQSSMWVNVDGSRKQLGLDMTFKSSWEPIVFGSSISFLDIPNKNGTTTVPSYNRTNTNNKNDSRVRGHFHDFNVLEPEFTGQVEISSFNVKPVKPQKGEQSHHGSVHFVMKAKLKAPIPREEEYDFDLTVDYDNSSEYSGGGGSGSCLVGSWERSICGSSTQKAKFEFKSNGSGSFSDWDCTLLCERYFPFNWVDNGSTITLNYGTPYICGQSQPSPGSGTQSYTCSGNTLNLGNTYSRK
jgi:hypothetical protein